MPAYDMKRPCLHCPFRTDDAAIRFSGRARAEEIEASAYLFGFPCHTTADYVEDAHGFDDRAGYVFGDGSQHCAGSIIMLLKAYCGRPWPGIGDDVRLLARLTATVDLDAPVFDTPDDFIRANECGPLSRHGR